MQNKTHLIWIDLEMTGLKSEEHVILEIGTIVTDAELHILAEGPVFALAQPAEELAKMDQWNWDQHGKSGLLDRVKNSLVSAAEAEAKTLAFLEKYVPAGESPMCGNSICQDRRFLYRHMPKLEAYFHYRHIDVSTLKELAKRWAPKIYYGLKKESKHTVISDIMDSIQELQYYREHILKI